MKRYRDILISFIAMFLACIILIAIAVYYHRRDNASKKNDEYITINGSLSSENKSYTSYDFAMGTSVSVTFYDAYLGVAGEEGNLYDALSVEVFKRIRKLDNQVFYCRKKSVLGRGGVLCRSTISNAGFYKKKKILKKMGLN